MKKILNLKTGLALTMCLMANVKAGSQNSPVVFQVGANVGFNIFNNSKTNIKMEATDTVDFKGINKFNENLAKIITVMNKDQKGEFGDAVNVALSFGILMKNLYVEMVFGTDVWGKNRNQKDNIVLTPQVGSDFFSTENSVVVADKNKSKFTFIASADENYYKTSSGNKKVEIKDGNFLVTAGNKVEGTILEGQTAQDLVDNKVDADVKAYIGQTPANPGAAATARADFMKKSNFSSMSRFLGSLKHNPAFVVEASDGLGADNNLILPNDNAFAFDHYGVTGKIAKISDYLRVTMQTTANDINGLITGTTTFFKDTNKTVVRFIDNTNMGIKGGKIVDINKFLSYFKGTAIANLASTLTLKEGATLDRKGGEGVIDKSFISLSDLFNFSSTVQLTDADLAVLGIDVTKDGKEFYTAGGAIYKGSNGKFVGQNVTLATIEPNSSLNQASQSVTSEYTIENLKKRRVFFTDLNVGGLFDIAKNWSIKVGGGISYAYNYQTFDVNAVNTVNFTGRALAGDKIAMGLYNDDSFKKGEHSVSLSQDIFKSTDFVDMKAADSTLTVSNPSGKNKSTTKLTGVNHAFGGNVKVELVYNIAQNIGISMGIGSHLYYNMEVKSKKLAKDAVDVGIKLLNNKLEKKAIEIGLAANLGITVNI